jgi:membrane fusion protein, multidrug efflux system
MENTEQPAEPAYRDGYREGFHDGMEQAQQAEKDEGDEQKEDKQDDEEKDDKGKKKTPLYKRPMVVAMVLLVVLLLIIAGIILWRHSRKHETTDDAFVDGYTSQLAAQTGGRVVKLYVIDNQYVNAGDPLLDIDSRDNDARTAQTQGQLAGAKGQYEQAAAQVSVTEANADQADAAARQSDADWRKAADDLARYRQVDPDAVSQQQVTTAVTSERSAREKRDAARQSARAAHAQIIAAVASKDAADAQIQAAQANLTAAQLQSSYTHVVAPISGYVSRRAVDVGNVISSGQALLAIVSKDLWVTANYKETQLTYMRRGQPVELTVDAFPSIKFHGQIDSIQKATGAYFSTLPAENATGNYVKVVQRVPVKILFVGDDYQKYAIGPGMSVAPDTTVR